MASFFKLSHYQYFILAPSVEILIKGTLLWRYLLNKRSLMSTTPPEDASKAAPRTPARPKREETRGYANRERTPTVESLEELETLWNTMGIQSEDLIPDTGGTIAPEPNGPGPKRLPTLESLPPLVTKAGGSTTPELDVGKTLGQGGWAW